MEIKFDLQPPTMPNFVTLKQDGGLRQEGFMQQAGFSIKSFTRQQAEEYGELMKQTFIKHWEQKQKGQ